MERYNSYKDSGVKWLGEIPSHWEMNKAKYYFYSKKEIVGKDCMNYERLALTLKGVIKRHDGDGIGLNPEKLDTYQIVEKNNLVFKLIDLENYNTSRVGLTPFDGIVSPAYIRLVRKGNVNERFFEYYYLNMWYRRIFNDLGAPGVRSNLSANDLLNLWVIMPSLKEQDAIVSYIDTATAKIDAAIAQQQKMIDLLNERKQIIINRAVTKGLNPNAKMKDSGVEWIGEVPEDWEVRRLGSLGAFFKGGNISRDDLQEYGKCAILYGDIYTKYNIQTSIVKNRISEKVAEKSVRITKGDLIMTGSGETKEDIGKTIVYHGDEAFIGGDVILFRQQNNDSTFLSYALNSQYAKDFRYKESKGEIIVHIYASSLKRLFLALPPIEEQIKVVKYLDGQIDAIDSEIDVINKQISLLQERKQIIINEVVTGKLRIL